MGNSIPASALVNVNPLVVGTGGDALALNAVFVTDTTGLIPAGEVRGFGSVAEVKALFGVDSVEHKAAIVYFDGFDGSSIKPSLLYITQYASSASAMLRGAALTGMTLSQLQALIGDLSVTIDGAVKFSDAIDFSAATSFSNAATLINDALLISGCTYDSALNQFVITGNTSITFASGTLAAELNLTEATGATISQGVSGGTMTQVMDAVIVATQNWATFATLFEADTAGKLELAAWTQAQNNRYAYVAWDTDVLATQISPLSFGAQVKALELSGVVPIYGADTDAARAVAAFVCGAAASIDFTKPNGRTTFAFRTQTGLAVTCDTKALADALIRNGYNFYGKYATATKQFNMLQRGSISGDHLFIDTFLDQVYFNSRIQESLLEMLMAVESLPYNSEGSGIIRTTMAAPVGEMLAFGAIRTGITLSAAQAAKVNQQAGVKIDDVLSTSGFYVQILPASPTARSNRTTPPMTLWYTDGGSIQQLNLDSIDVI
jgi:hypothetical protein